MPQSSGRLVHPWGKLQRNPDDTLAGWQSLVGHSRDVAVFFRALVSLPTIRERLASAAGQSTLSDSTLDRLATLVFLHDLGKVNTGFQDRINPRRPPIGHIAPLASLFGTYPIHALTRKAYEALSADVLEAWGPATGPLLHAIFSHHGAPWPWSESGDRFAIYWATRPDYDCWSALHELTQAAFKEFPGAFIDIEPLPEARPFEHLVAGFAQLADWIGSASWTPDRRGALTVSSVRQALQTIGLDVESWRGRVVSRAPAFPEVFGRQPYPHQVACAAADGQLVILEAETGSGKTEAALSRFLRLFADGVVDGLYFAVPTRTAAVQLHRRVQGFVNSVCGNDAPQVVLAVPGYLEDSRDGALPMTDDPMDKVEGDGRTFRDWASLHPKRFFSAMFGVGTIDQALLAALRVKHAHLRAATLSRHLLVIDEVHASDHYMQSLTRQLLTDHLAIGGHALLLSATLATETRLALLASASVSNAFLPDTSGFEAACATPYPLLSATGGVRERVIASTSPPRQIQISAAPLIDAPDEVAHLSLDAATQGAKVLVIRNTVQGAVDVHQALLAQAGDDSHVLFRAANRPAVHHGRFAREDRILLDQAVEAAIGRERPTGGLVLVGTQTLEQSLDIDADFLITDLCPVDVLLQRLGRLHRHHKELDGEERERPGRFAEPTAIVLVPSDGLAPYVSPRLPKGRNRHGLGYRESQGSVIGTYTNVAMLEATRRLIERYPVWRIPEMNRRLVEEGLHSASLEGLLTSLREEEREQWTAHLKRLDGDRYSKATVAALSTLRRTEQFMNQPLDSEGRATTRLGSEGRLVTLPSRTAGAFAPVITSLNIPAWMIRSQDLAGEPVIRNDSSNGFLSIQIGTTHLDYDVLGLRHSSIAQ